MRMGFRFQQLREQYRLHHISYFFRLPNLSGAGLPSATIVWGAVPVNATALVDATKILSDVKIIRPVLVLPAPDITPSQL